MNGTYIQEYKDGHIIKSQGKYYFVKSAEASLASAEGYESIAELVKAQEPKEEPKSERKTAKKSK